MTWLLRRSRDWYLSRDWSENDAEDLTQEVFVQAFRHVGSFRSSSVLRMR